MRTYSLTPGRLGAYLAAYEAEGLALQRQHLGDLVGYFSSETGELNQVVHIWAYPDLAERANRRAAMWADPAWTAYADTVLPWVTRMETTLLNPTNFSPLY